MARLIIAGVIFLSILAGIAWGALPSFPINDVPIRDLLRILRGNAAIEQICSTDYLKHFIQCEVIPGRVKIDGLLQHLLTCCCGAGVSQGAAFNPGAIRTTFSTSGGVVFATAKTTSLVARLSDLRLIWKMTGAVRGSIRTPKERIPVENAIRVRLFCFLSCCFIPRMLSSPSLSLIMSALQSSCLLPLS